MNEEARRSEERTGGVELPWIVQQEQFRLACPPTRMRGGRLDQSLERGRLQHCIVVQQENQLACCGIDSLVARADKAEVLLVAKDANVREPLDLVVARRIVDDDRVEIRIALHRD